MPPERRKNRSPFRFRPCEALAYTGAEEAVIVLYSTLLLCAVVSAALVARYDLYEREPPHMLLLAALVGGALMWGVGHLEDATLAAVGGPEPGAATFAAIAAVEEELARLVLVIVIAWIVPFHLNDPIDGLIYGSMAGLGMAVEESRWLIQLSGANGWVLPASELARLCGHVVLGGITGFAIGMARFGMRRWKRTLVVCFAASVAIHFVWDWIAFAAAGRGFPLPAETLAAIALMLTGMALYGALVVIGSRWSRAMFAPESPRILWGWPFAGRR